VSSSPSGAAIYLDGAYSGKTTPATLTGIPVGSHSVRCTKSGYPEQSQTVTVNGGQTATATFSFQSSGPSSGSISVSSSPSGAAIYLDGANYGSTPTTLSPISTGSHTIVLKKTGFSDYSTSVSVSSGKTTSVSATLQSPGSGSSGVKYALLVGISKYKVSSNNIDGVQYDTPHMKDMLINDCEYSSSRITTLTDSRATKSAIKSALSQMSSKATSDDTFVFYFSGQGFSSSQETYIGPYDTKSTSYSNDISSSELKQLLDGFKCRNVLVIIDACESGGMLKAGEKDLVIKSQVNAGINKNSNMDQFTQNFLSTFESPYYVELSSSEQQKALSGSKYVVLVSSGSDEDSWTNALSGSWFTTYIVEGIGTQSSDSNSDNWVSAEEAFNYASPLTTQKHSEQHPLMYDGNIYSDLQMSHYG
jgi:hypothetical protein